MEIRSARETIGDIKYSGFTTSFDLPVTELLKKWWKYSKSIGIVENMKSYYLVKIPPQENLFCDAVDQVKLHLRKKDMPLFR